MKAHGEFNLLLANDLLLAKNLARDTHIKLSAVLHI